MVFTNIHDAAGNGKSVSTTVTLLMDTDGRIPKKPWRVSVSIDGSAMFTSHHETRTAAEKNAEGMHATYLSVHAAWN